MNHDQFVALVARLEPIATRDPVGYERRVVLLALLGYAYLGLVLALLVGLLVGSAVAILWLKFVAVKVIILVAPFIWLVLKALWVKFPPPEGVEITRETVPELFAMIEKLQRQVGSARFHHVLITNDFNAAVQQNPRLGLFGWHRNYLLIGLPLMKGLTPAQLEAVFAHEFGHLAGGHGAVTNHIYRLRLSWARLLEVLEREQSAGLILFKHFFKWYSPYFSAYSFPLARVNEYRADAVAAKLCGAPVAAQALTSVEVVANYLGSNFWPGIHKQAETFPQPAFAPFQAMSGQFSTAELMDGAQAVIERALQQATNVDNTHPALCDRLNALQAPASFLPPAPGAAADILLGPSLQRITELYDEDWKRAVAQSWQQRHESVKKGLEQLAEFAARESTGEQLTPDEQFQYVVLVEDIGAGAEEGFARLRALHERMPEHLPTCYHLGLRLLAKSDDAGIELIEKCMKFEPESILPGCETLFQYCVNRHRHDEAARYQRMYSEKSGQRDAIANEENSVTLKDRFEQHGLPPEVIEALRGQLRTIGKLRKVYFVRRRLNLQPDKDCFAMGFRVTPWWTWQRSAIVVEAQRRILENVSLPGMTVILCIEGENNKLGRKFRKVRGSRVL